VSKDPATKKSPAKKSKKRSLSVGDLTPSKDPKGGTDHDLPPGQAKKTGGAGGC
jgi:hypothetical protein